MAHTEEDIAILEHSKTMRLYALDSMKFLAFLAIYLHHLNYTPDFGTLSVTFFFVVAGFIMAFTHGREEIDYRKYFSRRLLRIYPVYLLTFIAAIPIMQMTHFETNIKFSLANILLLQCYFPIGIQVFAYNGVAWFIADLMLFWAVTPFILAALHRVIGKTDVLMFLGFVLFTVGVAISYVLRDNMEAYSFGWWLIYISPYFRIIDYLIGLLAGLIFVTIQKEIVRGKALFSVLEVTALVLLVATYFSSFFGYVSLKYDLYYVPAFVIIIFVFAFQSGIFSSLLSFRPLVHLGNINYPIYMIHQLMITYVAQLFIFNIYGSFDNSKKLFIQISLFLVIICIGDVINRYFEEPSMRRLKPSQT